MKRVSLVIGVVLLAMTVAVAWSRSTARDNERRVVTPDVAAPTQVLLLKVPDMFCAGCEVGVKIAANKIDGVKDVKTDSDTRTAEITFDPGKTTPESIASAITKGTGFDTEVIKADRGKS